MVNLTSPTCSPPAAILARMEVVVVPMLEPKVKGYTRSRLYSAEKIKRVQLL
jgi:hypothetical protein